MIRIVALILTTAFIALARSGSHRRAQRATERLALGEDGIIRGAGPIRLEGGDRANGRPGSAANGTEPSGGGGRGAVLLLHGFGDTPQSLARLGHHLHETGWTVSIPLLPGHGRSLQAFAASGAEDWLNAARAELAELRSEHYPVFLLGQSMGGALATILAAESADVPGLILLAPYFGMPRSLRWLARSHPVLGVVSPWLISRDPRSILDDEARDASLGYGALAPRLLNELRTVSRRAREAAIRVRAPVLTLYSGGDNRVEPADVERTVSAMASGEKWLVKVDGAGHVISVDFGHRRVAELVERWIARRGAVRRPGAAIRGDEVVAE